MKLVMDLYLQAGFGHSFPLVLRMLGKALENAWPEVSVVVFGRGQGKCGYRIPAHATKSACMGTLIPTHSTGGGAGGKEGG